MIKIRRFAIVVLGLGLSMAGALPEAWAGGHFRRFKKQQPFSVVSPMVTTSSFAVASPLVTSQTYAWTTPAVTVPAYSFATALTTPAYPLLPAATTPWPYSLAPLTGTQAFALAPAYQQQTLVPYALSPMPLPSGQVQAQAQSQSFAPAAQIGLSDIGLILNLLERLRGALVAGGGGPLSPSPAPGLGSDWSGSRPIEVKVTICDERSSPKSSSDRSSEDQTSAELDQMLRQLGILQLPAALQAAGGQAVSPGTQAQALPQRASEAEQIQEISDQIQQLKAELEALRPND